MPGGGAAYSGPEKIAGYNRPPPAVHWTCSAEQGGRRMAEKRRLTGELAVLFALNIALIWLTQRLVAALALPFL